MHLRIAHVAEKWRVLKKSWPCRRSQYKACQWAAEKLHPETTHWIQGISDDWQKWYWIRCALARLLIGRVGGSQGSSCIERFISHPENPLSCQRRPCLTFFQGPSPNFTTRKHRQMVPPQVPSSQTLGWNKLLRVKKGSAMEQNPYKRRFSWLQSLPPNGAISIVSLARRDVKACAP